jgi:SAM-dependent methyltransferase
VITDAIVSTLKRFPPIWRRIHMVMDAFYRASMYPFGRDRKPGVARESSQLVADTDKLNTAAEHYFTAFDNHEFLLTKPFSDSESFPRHLFSLGVIFSAIGLRPTDVVVEFGSGTCWVSHFLNRYGCKTISVDVSPTALALGRQMFERDQATRWPLAPEFVPYDGHRIPLPDACCDKIVVIDAFHHIPNQRQILSEMVRILKPEGVIGMSEPGVGHAASDASKHEVETYGVLENELVIEDLGALAKSVGFTAASIVTASPDGLWEVPTEDLGGFFQGKKFIAYWQHQCNALLASHYILLYKGDSQPSTRRPKALRAEIEVAGPAVIKIAGGVSSAIKLTITNPTETRWLAAEGEGWTRVGAHLFALEPERQVKDLDWLRVSLPHNVERDKSVDVEVRVPPLEAGKYEVVFDLVIEGVAWFESRGSTTTRVTLVVT